MSGKSSWRVVERVELTALLQLVGEIWLQRASVDILRLERGNHGGVGASRAGLHQLVIGVGLQAMLSQVSNGANALHLGFGNDRYGVALQLTDRRDGGGHHHSISQLVCKTATI